MSHSKSVFSTKQVMASFPQLHPSPFSSSTLGKSLYASSFVPKSPIHSFSFPKCKPLICLALHSSATSNSRPQSLKSRLKHGENLHGIFLLTFSPTIAEIAGLAGYDFAVVDMEHGPGGISDALPCLHALAATNTPAILRLPECSATWAKRALDLRPQGILFPMIDNAKAAREAVSYCRYPPNGVCGSALTIVRASNYGFDKDYLSNYEKELLIMCQVESIEGVKNIDEIAHVDGVDCIQTGPRDLSASMGYLWDPGNKKVMEVLRAAERTVLKGGGAYLSGFVTPYDSAEELRRRGCHMVAGATDVALFRDAAVADVKKFKRGLVEQGDYEYEDKKGNGAAVALAVGR